jgi:predicted ATP-grasp superfamily ATP-dependent carboligase
MAVDRSAKPTDADKSVILMGFAEALAAIETAWSLQDAGFKVVAFCRAGSKPALRHVRGVDLHEVPRPELAATETAAAVRKLCDVLMPAALLPLDDHAVWVCSQLEAETVPVAGPSGSAVDYALDKSLQLEAARQAGLPVPSTEVAEDLTDTKPISFPAMVKPARALYEVNGVLERPTGMVCANSEEFEHATAKPWPGSLLVQPLIRGVGEGLFGHVGPQGVIGWSAHRRVRMVNPQGSASSACRSEPVDGQLVDPSERLLEAIGWQGMFMLEFLRDSDGTPWFMELNGRAWGSMALARRRGFEYPAWTVQAALGTDFKPAPPREPPEIRCRNLGLELVHLAFVARGPQSGAAMEWPRLSRAVRDVCTFAHGDRLYNWNRSQPAVLVADTVETLRTYAGKVRRQRP